MPQSTQWLFRLLLPLVLATSTALASDVARPVLDAGSLEPTQEVRGLKQETHARLWGEGGNMAADAQKHWLERVAPGRTKLTGQEVQCLFTHFTKAVAEGALAGANQLAPGVPRDVLARYVGFLDKQLEYFCRPPPGGGANAGQAVMEAWVKAVTAQANQKGLFQEVRTAFEKLGREERMTPREVAIAVAVALVLAAKEVVPAPL